MSSREYSKRLGILSDEQLQAALEHFDLGQFVSAEPIPFGLFGQNLFITSTQGEFVLRGVPHYPWQFPTEKFFTELLHGRTRVPVPHPYLFEPSTTIFGWSFVLMPRICGLQIANETFARTLAWKDRCGIARALARTLVEAQTLTWECAGKYIYETHHVEPMTQEYRAWIVTRVRELVAQTATYNTNTPASDIEWTEPIIAQALPALDTPYHACIVFEDYKEANTVVERTEDGWRVSGVFDLMTAHFGDGEADLARQVGTYLRQDPSLADQFLNEYLQNKSVAPGFAERQKLYMLYDSAIIWEYFQRTAGGLPEDKTLTLEKWAGPFVAYWDKFVTR